jgi:hypothetical protein
MENNVVTTIEIEVTRKNELNNLLFRVIGVNLAE